MASQARLFLLCGTAVYLGGFFSWLPGVPITFPVLGNHGEGTDEPFSIPSWLAAVAIFCLLWYSLGGTQFRQKKQDRLIHVLYDGGNSCLADIVAVHGLGSTPETTWNHKVQDGSANTIGPMWLRDFLPRENLRARIMVFNHNSVWKKNATIKSLEDHGNDLLGALDRERKTAEERDRPIIFIGHSFGGILIKQALYTALTSDVDNWRRQIAQHAHGFVFLGTPHKGSSLTLLGHLMATFCWWRGSNNTLLRAIQPGSSKNQRIHERFIQTYPVKEMVVCFFEAELTRILGIPLVQVVRKDSARIENADSFGFESNHQNLQRFQSRGDEDYRTLVHYLHKYIDRATKTTPAMQHTMAEELNTEPRGRGLQNHYFFGRDVMIEELHRHIEPGPPGTQQKMKVCVLHGLGGTGKTQVATEYTYRYEKTYKHIFWVRAEEPAEAARGFSSIASQFSDEVDNQQNQQRSIEVARARLRKSKEPWLLVFDNVVSREDVKRYIPEGTAGSIIITTQSTEVKDLWPSQILVRPFNDDDAAHLLLQYLNPRERFEENGVQDSLENAKKISKLVGGLPLAIAVIAGYISTSKCTLPVFIADFDQSPQVFRGWAQSEGPFASDYEKPLRALFDMALQKLQPESRSLLDCLSFMNPDEIEESMIFRVHEHSCLKFLSTTESIRVRLLQRNLYGRHLTEKKPSSRPHESGSLSIHRHVKHHLQAKLLEHPARYNEAFLRALLLIRAVFPRQDAGSSPTNQKWPLYEKYYMHVLSLHAAYKEALRYSEDLVSDPPVEFGHLLSDLGNYMYERYLIRDAFKILDTATAVLDKLLGTDSLDPERIQVLYVRASIELNYGITKRQEGVARKEQIVRLRCARLAQVYRGDKEVHEVASRQLSTAYNNLACAYMHCDDYERAMPFFHKSTVIKKKWLRVSLIPQLAAFSEINKNLALVFLSRGDADTALRYANKAVALIDQWSPGGPRTKVGQFMRFIRACVLFNIGDKKGALEANLEILKARFEILGESHDHTIDSYYAVGMIFASLEDWHKAEFSLRKCLQLRNEYFETRIPRVLCCLGRVLAHLNEHEESAKLLCEARELFQRLLPERAPGVDFSDPDEMVRYDQIVNLWSGRFTGKLNLEWQKARSQRVTY